MDFSLSAELAALASEARAVGRAAAERSDAAGRPTEDTWIVAHDDELGAEMARRGWLGMTWPTEEGGHGRSALERFVVVEALISEGAPLAGVWFADRQIGPTLLQHGTPEQRARWLPDIVAGRARWCIGMSEPDAGSDVASLRTRARPDGSGWRVDGTKVWTSGAAVADWCYLVARTDPDAPPHRGLSELVVDMRAPGVEVRPITDAVGDRHFCEVTFTDVEVPGTHLVGEPNGSFRQIMRQMEHERGGIDRLVSNHRLLRDVAPFADVTDPRVRQQIASLHSDHAVGRLMVLREVMGQAPPSFSAATKTFCTEHEQRVAAFCAATLGPSAVAGDSPLARRVARNLCYSPAYTLMGGTTQILRTIIGERMLGLPRGA